MSTSVPAPTTNTSSNTDLTIPKACVKRIMKLNDEVSNVSAVRNLFSSYIFSHLFIHILLIGICYSYNQSS